MISLIAAIGKNRELGFKNKLPWHLPDDLKHFREITTGHAVVMGRRTFESIGKPLPNRKNIVMARSLDFEAPGFLVAHSFGEVLALAGNDTEVFVIGGAETYATALPVAKRMYLTFVDAEVPADSFFPDFNEAEWREISSEHHPADDRHPYSFTFKIFERQ
jgi:dihydrofolate reductase